MTKQLVPLRLQEWELTKQKAFDLWRRSTLGVRPTFDAVRAIIPNPHTITPLEWAAMVVLVVLTIWTSYKVGALAVPFSENTLVVLTADTYLSPLIQNSFVVVTALMFMLMATPSLIYFKLLADEPELRDERKATKNKAWYQKFSLEYLTPRLPGAIVYLSVGWLVVISNRLPGTVFEQYLPVIIEVGLATLVGNILKKRREFNEIVYVALNERERYYELQLANYELDPAYKRLLYQVMRENVMNLHRTSGGFRTNHKPNAWLEQVDEPTVYAVLLQEYRRLTGGDQFIADTAPTPQAVPVTDPATVPTDIPAHVEPQYRRKPTDGADHWTPESLYRDLRARGINPASGYGEGELRRDYDSAYQPRRAWRGGARQKFLGK